MENQIVVFTMASVAYGVNIASVESIIKWYCANLSTNSNLQKIIE